MATHQDRLRADLRREVAQRINKNVLYSLGFFEFLNLEESDFADEVELAYLTVEYCCFNATGAWRNCEVFLAAVLEFIDSKGHTPATDAQPINLMPLVVGGSQNLDPTLRVVRSDLSLIHLRRSTITADVPKSVTPLGLAAVADLGAASVRPEDVPE